jgi:ketosteroid isomerase-like protein
MTPRQVVEEWVRRFNSGDADGLAELYHEDAVNHQVVQEPISGKVAIREMFRREFAAADMTCIPEVIHEAGNVAILERRDPLGLRGCGFFHSDGRSHRLPARLLGQAIVSQEARPASRLIDAAC